jgi:tetratricopeptide (TPR) repeat protein
MKTRSLFILSFLLVGMSVYSQKKELRDASKLIKQGSFTEAISTLKTLEGTIESADEDIQAEYYLNLGRAYAGKPNMSAEEASKSAKAFEKLKTLNSKHARGLEGELSSLRIKIFNSAVGDQNAGNYQSAADKLLASYTLSPQDTSDLYYAAINLVNAKNYSQAIGHFEKLLDLNYQGVTKLYTATHKDTGEIERFEDKADRDLLLKTGQYIKPTEEVSASKRADIISSLGILYIDQDNLDKAKTLIAEARAVSPNDISLVQAEATIALKLNDMKKYNELMQQVVASDPDNHELYFNLGVSAANMKDFDNAQKYYLKALEIEPNYYNANINYALLIIEKGDELVEEMNSLGMSAADNKKYDQLQEQLYGLYRESIPYFKKATEIKKDDVELKRTLMNIYTILGDDAEAKKIRETLQGDQ